MADRKVTVLNPAGYQEQLPDTDNLLVAATPTANLHAVNKLYVDQQDGILSGQISQEVSDRQAGDQSLQGQIDAIIAQGELQTLQDVTDLGSTTTNDITSTGTITAAVLVGDIDQGEY